MTSEAFPNFLSANIGRAITNVKYCFISHRSDQMFTRKRMFSVSYYSPKCLFVPCDVSLALRSRPDACCSWGSAWRHAQEARPSGKPRAKMAARCFLSLVNIYIYILLYTSSIVCKVRIQVVDGRSGDFSQLQNSWITSNRSEALTLRALSPSAGETPILSPHTFNMFVHSTYRLSLTWLFVESESFYRIQILPPLFGLIFGCTFVI